nr:MAG TPA: hypothetical protein [Caudoviricetes sp.]
MHPIITDKTYNWTKNLFFGQAYSPFEKGAVLDYGMNVA